ncbi:MAG: hypothetical protein ACFFD4_17960 [Candidatus Odinarchaeota archaeon]
MTLQEIRDKLEASLTKAGIIDSQKHVIQVLERIKTAGSLSSYSVKELEELILGIMKVATIQQIRNEGARVEELDNDYIGDTRLLSLLFHMKLVTIDKWYSHNLLKLTALGEELAGSLLDAKLKELARNKEFAHHFSFALWLFNRLLPRGGSIAIHFEKGYRYSGMNAFPVLLPGDLTDIISTWLEEFPAWQNELKKLIEDLESKQLIYKANSYVAKEPREQRYCVSLNLGEFINKLVNTEYGEIKKSLDNQVWELEQEYYSLQFFDRQLFQHGDWERGIIEYGTAVKEFDAYRAYQARILKIIEKLEPAFLLDSSSRFSRLPEITVKSPGKFMELYRPMVDKLFAKIAGLPDLNSTEPEEVLEDTVDDKRTIIDAVTIKEIKCPEKISQNDDIQIDVVIQNHSDNDKLIQLWYQPVWSSGESRKEPAFVITGNSNGLSRSIFLPNPREEGQYKVVLKLLDEQEVQLPGQETLLEFVVKRSKTGKLLEWSKKGGSYLLKSLLP